MSSDALKARGRTLEEAFFAQKNEQLLKAFHEKLEADERRAEIMAVTGVNDEPTLDKLMDLGVDAQSIAAVSLIPLIRVAWVDRAVEAKEREAIMTAAEQSGVETGNSAHELLLSWLDQRPDDKLYDAWTDYVEVLKETLDAEAFKKLGDSVTSRAKSVAAAAGGILGFGKVSAAEQQVLDEIAKALS